MMISKYAKYKLYHCHKELKCRDGSSGFEYNMPCLVLEKGLPNKQWRILVFGDRYGKYLETRKTMRVVDKSRVIKKPKEKK